MIVGDASTFTENTGIISTTNLSINANGTFSQSGGISIIGTLDIANGGALIFSGGNMTVTTSLTPPSTVDFYVNSSRGAASGPSLTLNGTFSPTFSNNIFIGDLGGSGTYVGSGSNSSLVTTSGFLFIGVDRAYSGTTDQGPGNGTFSLASGA